MVLIKNKIFYVFIGSLNKAEYILLCTSCPFVCRHARYDGTNGHEVRHFVMFFKLKGLLVTRLYLTPLLDI
jgi:hypothetical protein